MLFSYGTLPFFEKESTMALEMANEALQQIVLIQENDYTLEGMVFRVKVSGKGCHGFDYSCGFTEPLENDLVYEFQFNDQQVAVHLDPFADFYLKNAKVDFSFNPKAAEDGFLVTNFDQKEFEGKFFKNDEAKVPEHLRQD